MNVLFLTILKISSINERGIYTDLMREFVKNQNKIFIVSPLERREKLNSKIINEKNATILRVKTLNLQKTSLIEKGVGQLLLEYQFLYKIKKEFSNIKFDLIIYNTPPITFSKVISYIKKKDNAYAYLLLKDIFPQNAVDLKMIRKDGVLHNFFLKKENKLYEVSDKIGCMSPANVEYLLHHNKGLSSNKVEVNPNSISPIEIELTKNQYIYIRKKYNLPIQKKIFIYGGNLGKPQGIDFLLYIIEKCNNINAYFLIVGTGVEFKRMNNYFKENKPLNAKLLNGLPKNDYDLLLASCDVGMIFLHKDFTIPNFPSRLLSYLEMKMPVFLATDEVTDIGEIVEKNNCGHSLISGNIVTALKKIDDICFDETNFKIMKNNSWNLLENQYKVEYSYEYIINSYLNKNV